MVKKNSFVEFLKSLEALECIRRSSSQYWRIFKTMHWFKNVFGKSLLGCELFEKRLNCLQYECDDHNYYI